MRFSRCGTFRGDLRGGRLHRFRLRFIHDVTPELATVRTCGRGSVKMLAALAGLQLLQAVAHAQVDLGIFVAETPYDPYFQSVKEVLRENRGPRLEMEEVRKLMKTARSFRYKFDNALVPAPPSVTEQMQRGDCKDKALWLCRAIGDPSLRYVVGKWRRRSSISHAWLLWRNDGHWWILDPTNMSEPLRADQVASSSYIARYSWDRYGKYVHNINSRYDVGPGKSRFGAVGAR